MKKIMKYFLILVLLIFLVFINSCDYNLNSKPFMKGKFVYNVPFVLYDNVCVDQMIMEFTPYEGNIEDLKFEKGEHEYYDDVCYNKNLIQNGFNDEIWNIKIYFKLYNTEEYIFTNTFSMKSVASVEGADAYNIRVDILDVNYELTYYFRFRLFSKFTENPFDEILFQLNAIFVDDVLTSNIQNNTDYLSIVQMEWWYLPYINE